MRANALMRTLLLLILLGTLTAPLWSQTPGIKYTKYIKTRNKGEHIFDAKPTPDGGYIVAGTDTTYACCGINQIDKAGSGRPWLAKLDSLGNMQWDYHIGTAAVNPHYSSFTSVAVTPDGGYVAAGYAGDYNNVDFYVTRFRSNGAVAWARKYGGTGMDKALDVIEANGYYVVVGKTTSNDGDVGPNHSLGGNDLWLVNLDTTGNITWKKNFGGTGEDMGYALVQAPDYGFLIAGSSSQANGDVTTNRGLQDGWIVKTDDSGNLQWQKSYGGPGSQIFRSLVLNSDGTYTAAGYTDSTNAEGYTAKGGKDLWVIKINGSNGNLIWSKGYGGSANEEGLSLKRTLGNGYVIGGYTASANGDVTANGGLMDAWLLRLSPEGNLVWQKTAGGQWDEIGAAVLYNSETDYLLFGTARPAVAHPDDVSDGYLVRFGNANTIKGTLFYDSNSNGLREAGEPGFNGALVKTTATGLDYATVTRNGAFDFQVDLGTFTTTPQADSRYYTVAPPSATSTFTTYLNTDSLGFAVQPIPNKKDLTISLVPLTAARPGFNVSYKVLYKNVGTTTIPSGEVLLIKDSRFTFLDATPFTTDEKGDTLKWIYTNLKPLDSASILVELRLKAPPQANINDTLLSMALINPVAGDETPRDDTAVLRQRVTGSYDPNDKTESNGGRITPDYITGGKYLTYTIRFQNMGTDTAFTVVVRDTLDNRLDWATLQVMEVSHPSYRLNIKDNRMLTFEFRNIDLPAVGIDEPASHGHIIYRVKPLGTVALGETIHNTASIYFDYNLPVLTNDAATTVVNAPALPVVTISGTPAGTFCRGTAVTFTATVTEGGSRPVYQWKINGANRGTNAATFTTTELNNGDVVTLYYTSTVSGEATTATSNSITAAVTTVLIPSINTPESLDFCEGSSVTLRANGSGSYQWYKDGIAISGATGQTYAVTAAGGYSVTATENGCTSDPSAVFVLSAKPVPAAPSVTAGSATSFCQGGSVVLTSSASSGNQWYKDGAAISGATAATYTAATGGTYSVAATVNGCTSAPSAGQSVTVNPLPATPTITAAGNVLTSSAATGNQWYKDGTAISGATAQSYTATASGTYSVQVSQGGCSATSASFNFVLTALTGPSAWNGEVVAYPNPVGKELFIRNTGPRRLRLQLVDAFGRIVYEGKLSATAGTIPAEGLAAGVYQLLVTDEKKKETIGMTIIKQ